MTTFMETMAELAFRYGEEGLPHRRDGSHCYFPDGSRLRRGRVDTPLDVKQWHKRMDELAIRLGGWETTAGENAVIHWENAR